MVFSYNWLQSFFKKKLPAPKKLAELLTLHFAEVEEVKKEGGDWALDIDIKPNRAGDCFSHLGIAREIAAITDIKFQVSSFEFQENNELKAKDFVTVEVKHKWACPRYTARVIIDVKVGSSPKWIQERLKVCGLRPINNVVDIANYVMLETGQPLHAFDGEKLEGRKIIVRFAKEKEKITTLDGQKFDLTPDVLVIADEKKPVGIAGIKGGKIPEIDRETKIVVLESANFSSQVIRQGSKKLNLKTDASLRFEHGIDPNLTEFAVNRAAFLIQKLTKGKAAKGIVDIYPKKVLPKRIKLDLNYLKSLLGIDIPKNKVIAILKKLEFNIINSKFNVLVVGVPTFRLDVFIPEDLIEEIARIFGYDKVPSVFPIAALIPPKRNLDIFWEDFSKNILKEAGFTEVYNYSFVSEKDISIYQLNQSRSALIELENPMSVEQKYLRPSLIPNLLKNVERNQKNFKEIKIFELGKVFKKGTKKGAKLLQELSSFGGLVGEKRMLTGVMTGDSFYQAKGVIDLLLNKLGISNIWYDSYQPTPEDSNPPTALPSKGRAPTSFAFWHPKKCAEIKIDNDEIGFLGEISPRILDEMKVSMKAVAFDIDFEKLVKLASEEHEYRPISRYPAAVRDMAILVPREVRVEEVLNKIEITGGPLVRDIDLFDIYEGEELPEGKKNLAFHIIYQAEDRTLSSKEIDEVQNKIINTLEENSEWEVRK